MLCHFITAEHLNFLLDLYQSRNPWQGYLLSLFSKTAYFKEESAWILLLLLHSGSLSPRVGYLLTRVPSVPLSQMLNN